MSATPVSAFLTILTVLFLASTLSHAGMVPVPNGSFENPVTPYVSINVQSWQKNEKPEDYEEEGGFLWSQLTGIFKNTPTNSVDHIHNCDGAQALWLFVVPHLGLFQDYDSVDWNDSEPSHELNVVYEVGSSYEMTVGIIGTGGNMLQGATLELSLYRRENETNRVNVAVTVVTNLSTIFSNNTHLIDFKVTVPPVLPTDPWAGKHLGIQFLSTVTTNLQGGYWDLDNVRLRVIPPPALTSPTRTNDQVQFELLSDPGQTLEVLATSDPSLNISNWTSLATITNTTGTTLVVDTNANFEQRYYRARQFP
jgi:hypothetical protein